MNYVKCWCFLMMVLALMASHAFAGNMDMDTYFFAFDYAERKAMKIDSPAAAELIRTGKAQLVDVRFKEEYDAWHMGDAVNIPLNELLKRIGELDKDKLVITACPHKDRAAMARLYLVMKGFKARYLEDGLTGLAEYLRGDRARDFINNRGK